MIDPTEGATRQFVSPNNLLDSAELAAMHTAGTLVIDDRRRRPLYFDGRFLTARDLNREQTYFLSRQADLNQATGSGVLSGLLVAMTSATSLSIMAGAGITPAGEPVVLPTSRTVNIDDLGLAQNLNLAFGLMSVPRDPSRGNTGIYILALRPVEFTANPIASYPTSLTDGRTVSDGDIIEAVAITLVPYSADISSVEADDGRARLAQQLFVQQSIVPLPIDALPIAAVALDHGTIQWVDPYLVRREVEGPASLWSLGAGFPSAQLREAHLLQYQQHLNDVVRARAATGRGTKFAASEHFEALPAAGPMPAGAINTSDFTQLYFPAEVSVSLSIIPDDEVPAIVAESFSLPPIDLTLSADDLSSTSVLVIVPVPRSTLRARINSLNSISRPLLPAAPGLVARRSPLEAIQLLRFPPIPVAPPASPSDSLWAELVNSAPLLWYARRRNLKYRADVVGTYVTLPADDLAREQAATARLQTLGLGDRFATLFGRATAAAYADMAQTLISPKFDLSYILNFAVIATLESVETLDKANTDAALAPYNDDKLGEGLFRLETAQSGALRQPTAFLDAIGKSGQALTLDRIGAKLPDDQLASYAGTLVGDLTASPQQIATDIQAKAQELGV